jgi:nitroreductase
MAEEQTSIFEIIHSLRAVRRYTSDPVEPEKLTEILKAGSMAPSSGNTQPWHFIAVTAPDLKTRIRELILPAFEILDSRGRVQTQEQLKDSTGRPVSGHWAIQELDKVPVLVFVCHDSVRGRRFKDEWRWFEDHAGRGGSIFPAIQNMLLTAKALGLGTLLSTLCLLRAYEIKELLHIPEHISLEAMVHIGYPDEKLGRPKRLPLDQVAHLNSWDIPYSS